MSASKVKHVASDRGSSCKLKPAAYACKKSDRRAAPEGRAAYEFFNNLLAWAYIYMHM